MDENCTQIAHMYHVEFMVKYIWNTLQSLKEHRQLRTMPYTQRHNSILCFVGTAQIIALYVHSVLHTAYESINSMHMVDLYITDIAQKKVLYAQ